MEKNWFYHKEGELKSSWKPFSMADSLALERAYSLRTYISYTPMYKSTKFVLSHCLELLRVIPGLFVSIPIRVIFSFVE